MNNQLYSLLIILLVNTLSVKAQEVTTEVFRTDKNTKVIELPEASRNYEKINFDVKQAPVTPLTYEVEEVGLNVPKLTTKIKVVTITPAPLEKLYGNYVKAGIGNYTTPYFEGFFNNKRSENWAYGIHLKHLSSQNGPVKFSGLSQNAADAYVNYFTKKMQVHSGLSYNRDRYNFYGFEQSLPVEKDTLKQIFNTLSFNVGFKNVAKDAPVNYYADFTYYNFRDHYNAKENEYLTDFGGKYKLDNDKAILTDAVLSISNRKDSSSINRSFFQIKPALFLNLGKYRVTGGFNLAYSSDTVNSNKPHLYPRVHVDVDIIENSLMGFAGLHGEMQKNTLRTFATENPFLQSDVPLLHSNKALELYGGIMGNYSGLNYKAKFAYSDYKNLYFFNNSFTDSSQFTILYDKNTPVLNLEADVSYDWSERFRLGVNMNYYNYNTSTLEKAWHRPNFTTSLLASYNIHKKIYINTDIYYISGLIGKNYISDKEVKLDGIFDASVKIDYKFSNVFSAFIEVNNILTKKYQRYLYYPVKGINVIGGISYSF